MVDYTEEQKRIALLLLHAPKTVEQLNAQLDIPLDRLTSELKEMLKLGVVEKREGYPTPYALKQDIADRIKRRKEIAETDENRLRLKVLIEGQAIERKLLEKHLQQLEAELRADKDFTIYDAILEKMIKEGDHFTSFLEVNLSVKDFRALMKLIHHYGPTSIEIIKPEKVTFSADELQDGLVDASEMVQAYTKYIQEQMTKKELEKFSAKLFK